VTLTRRAVHAHDDHDHSFSREQSVASSAHSAAEQVGVGLRLTNDPPFSVVSLVPGGAAALSGAVRARDPAPTRIPSPVSVIC
jgi:hypothetical protein